MGCQKGDPLMNNKKMSSYKWQTNLKYMLMAFYRPDTVITGLLTESSPFYCIVPFVIYLIIGMVATFVAVIQGASPNDSANPFPTPILPPDYYKPKLVLYPFFNIIAVIFFATVAWILSHIHTFRRVSVRKAVLFLMFLSTIGIVAIIIESLSASQMIISIVMPLVGVIAVVYLAEFIHKQAKLARYQALIFSLISLTCYYIFRGLTMR